MSKVLVSGASGYIGGRLLAHLTDAGFSVRGGSRGERSGKGVDWVLTDYESRDSLVRACEGCDTVVHLASLNEVDCARSPEAATIVNTLYTQRLADAAAAAGVRRFLYLSTVHVYGSPLLGTIREDTPTRPSHPYSISHKAAEDYLAWSVPGSGVGTVVLRLTNSFGYPESRDVNRWMLVANDAAKQAAAGGRIVLRSSGTQLRDFIPLGDVCDAVEFFVRMEPVPSAFDVFNLGGGRTASVLDLVSLVAAAYSELTGRGIRIDRPEAQEVGRTDLSVSIDKIRELGFSPRREWEAEIRELVRRCLDWFGPGIEAAP